MERSGEECVSEVVRLGMKKPASGDSQANGPGLESCDEALAHSDLLLCFCSRKCPIAVGLSAWSCSTLQATV